MNEVVYDLEVEIKHEYKIKMIIETLTRIGIPSGKKELKRTLYQSCHLIKDNGKYYIVHFKELFKKDGKFSSLDDNDIARRNTIAFLLNDWGLLTVKNPIKFSDNVVPLGNILIISHKDKQNWILKQKYMTKGLT